MKKAEYLIEVDRWNEPNIYLTYTASYSAQGYWLIPNYNNYYLKNCKASLTRVRSPYEQALGTGGKEDLPFYHLQ